MLLKRTGQKRLVLFDLFQWKKEYKIIKLFWTEGPFLNLDHRINSSAIIRLRLQKKKLKAIQTIKIKMLAVYLKNHKLNKNTRLI